MGAPLTLVSEFVKVKYHFHILDVPPIACDFPPDEELFGPDQVNVHLLQDHFSREGRLRNDQVRRILREAIKVLRQEPNLLTIPAPIILCGDIHGQYFDLLKLFAVAGGPPPQNRYLFLGDYVDRGSFSLECFILLLAMKISYRELIFMLRGNHECRHLTKHFTFKLECTKKYSAEIYDLCMEAFDSLPLAAVVNEQFFCVHGGISPELKTPADVNKINRFAETPKYGLFCDLLWSDPTPDFGDEMTDNYFIENGSRGCSFKFTYAAACSFLRKNNLLSIVRGHEAQDAGYRLYRTPEKSDFPALITLFSAANYIDVYKNKGAIIKYDGEMLNIRQFNAAPHPYSLPKFMNAFDWSLPFVGEKVAELIRSVLSLPTANAAVEDITADELKTLEEERRKREELIKAKIKTVGRINRMFHNVRMQRETLSELMNVMGTEVIPAHYLTLGEDELRQAIRSFEEARRCDMINEMLPPSTATGTGDGSDTASVTSLNMDPEYAKETMEHIRAQTIGRESPQPQSRESVRCGCVQK